MWPESKPEVLRRPEQHPMRRSSPDRVPQSAAQGTRAKCGQCWDKKLKRQGMGWKDSKSYAKVRSSYLRHPSGAAARRGERKRQRRKPNRLCPGKAVSVWTEEVMTETGKGLHWHCGGRGGAEGTEAVGLSCGPAVDVAPWGFCGEGGRQSVQWDRSRG